MAIDRHRTVRRADRLLRIGLWTAGLLLLSVAVAVSAELGWYYGVRLPAQQVRAEQLDVSIRTLPAEAANWLAEPRLEGDPWLEYEQVLLDFRAREFEYVAAKLRGEPTAPGRFRTSIELLERAARRPPAPLTFAVERQLRGRDLVDSTEVLVQEARRLVDAAATGAYDTTETLKLRARAELLLRSRYSTGHYLATRRFTMTNVALGVRLMRQALGELRTLFRDEQRSMEEFEVEQLRLALDPIDRELAHLLSYRSAATDVEAWVKMLEQGATPAVRLQGAFRLADVARRYWRLGESLRAASALEEALAARDNNALRGELYEALRAARSDRSIALLIDDLTLEADGSDLTGLD